MCPRERSRGQGRPRELPSVNLLLYVCMLDAKSATRNLRNNRLFVTFLSLLAFQLGEAWA